MSHYNDFDSVIGCTPEAYCKALSANMPGWVAHPLSDSETLFLFEIALNAGANLAVEIGTGPGFSTSVLCQALNIARQAGKIDSDFHVVSYDSSSTYYADASRRVGDATREQLSPELLKHITFRNPALAASLKQHYDDDAIEFLFIDADHRHPWPTLDFLATLDLLKCGAVVILHDINLPVAYPEFQDWGAKYLFDALDLEKGVPQADEVPNIGSIRISEDKELLRARLLEILDTHEWQADVEADYLTQLGLTRERPA
jgi:predicted O-methyltransferase YrrM